eukprot:6814121-Prorocentrum_lima.AAC.1
MIIVVLAGVACAAKRPLFFIVIRKVASPPVSWHHSTTSWPSWLGAPGPHPAAHLAYHHSTPKNPAARPGL